MGVLDDLDAAMTVECPRCGETVEQAFYGPCGRCHGELRAAYQADPGSGPAAAVEYEPKMNVTPNAVALKDD